MPYAGEAGEAQMVLKTWIWSSLNEMERTWIQQRGHAHEVSTELTAAIRDLVEDVRVRGDEALCDALKSFDGIDISPDGLLVTEAEFSAAEAAVRADLRAAIRQMIANIRAFNEALASRRQSWTQELGPGHVVGEVIGPVASAAVFCPSGKAATHPSWPRSQRLRSLPACPNLS